MNKFTFTLFSIFFSALSFGQYCGNSGAAICTPAAATGTAGFNPTAENLPCFVKGTNASQILQIEVPASVSGFPVQWVKLDTISNLPTGLCWATNSSTNQVNGGSTACIKVSGTPIGAVGQYKLRIIATINVTGVGTFPNMDLSTQGFKYWVRLKCTSADACPGLDTVSTANFIGYTACATNLNVAITPSSTQTKCQGDSVILVASGANTYKWSNGATTSTIIVKNSGSYSVTGYNATMDSAMAGPVSVVIVQPHTVGIVRVHDLCPDSIINPGVIQASVNPGGPAYNYLWSNGSTAQTITVSNPGTYTVTVTSNACTVTASQLLTKNPLNCNVTQSGSLFVADFSSANSYQWYLNGSPISGAEILNYNATQGGAYSVEIYYGDCSCISAPIVWNSIKDLETINNVQVYPNPTAGMINVNLTSEINQTMSVSVENMLGAKVLSLGSMEINKGTNARSVNISNLSNGTYLLVMEINQRKHVQLITKQ